MRIQKLKTLLKDMDCDAAVIMKPQNIFYFTGFSGEDSCLYCSQSQAAIITDSRYTEQAKTESNCKVIESDRMVADVSDMLDGKRRVLFEQDYVVHSVYTELCRVSELIEGSNEINAVRAVKDDTEIEKIKAAQAVTDLAFEYIIPHISAGVTEHELAAELEYFMRKKGAGTAFPTIVAFGAHASMPHAVPGNDALIPGQAVLMDFGARLNGYCSDMTRTVFYGCPSDQMKKIYNIVLEAQTRVIEALHEGMECQMADAIARKCIESYGYGKAFGHGLGHGLGIECHEAPRLSPKGSGKLEQNMVVTVEPGIYLPGEGGVRIENLCVIRHRIEQLTQTDNSLMII